MPVRGGSKGRKKQSLHDLGRAELVTDAARSAFEEIESSSDRTAAILGATMVQAVLRSRIVNALPRAMDPEALEPLMERDGALATFFSTIHLAFALDLITQTMTGDLSVIRRVRNVFAHSVLPLEFTHADIRREVRKLSVYHPPYTKEIWTEMAASGTFPDTWSQERVAFVSTCNVLIHNIMVDDNRVLRGKIKSLVKQLERYVESSSNADDIDK